jgi:hypothetical protein
VRFSSVGAIAAPAGSVLQWIGAGLLGANAMRAAVWQLDFPARTVTIARSIEGLGHVRGGLRLRFRPHSSSSPSPIVDIGIGKVQVPFLVDTGFDGGLAVHPSDHPGGPAVVELSLGDQPSRPQVLKMSDRLTAGLGLIGVGFLADQVLTIDWVSETLYLDPGWRPRTGQDQPAAVGPVGRRCVPTCCRSMAGGRVVRGP